jgi:hypothetical protein
MFGAEKKKKIVSAANDHLDRLFGVNDAALWINSTPPQEQVRVIDVPVVMFKRHVQVVRGDSRRGPLEMLGTYVSSAARSRLVFSVTRFSDVSDSSCCAVFLLRPAGGWEWYLDTTWFTSTRVHPVSLNVYAGVAIVARAEGVNTMCDVFAVEACSIVPGYHDNISYFPNVHYPPGYEMSDGVKRDLKLKKYSVRDVRHGIDGFLDSRRPLGITEQNMRIPVAQCEREQSILLAALSLT